MPRHMRKTQRVELGRLSICKRKRQWQKGRETNTHLPNKKEKEKEKQSKKARKEERKRNRRK